MTNQQKVISRLPLTELRTEGQDTALERKRFLTSDDIKELIKTQPVTFVVADVGRKLNWVAPDNCFQFWKSEVKPNLVDDPDGQINLSDFPDDYAYLASKWTGKQQDTVVLLEKYH